MRLEWFREHKNFVYWILLPVVGGTMAFFGVGSMRGGSLLGGNGPTMRYTVGKTEKTMSPSEILAYRIRMSNYLRRGGDVRTTDVGEHVVEYNVARDSGFETGSDEMKFIMRNAVKNQIQMREPSADIKVDDETYQKLLNAMHMTDTDFERMTHEVAVRGKYQQFAMSYPIGDGELFAEYCRDKEVVRLRYKEFKSTDYLSKVSPANDEKVKDFYTKNKDSKTDMKDILYTQPTMAAELIALDSDKFLKEMKPADDELKNYYERHKAIVWREAVKPGDPPTPPDQIKYKPFDTVKTEVEEKWRDEKKNQVSSELSTLKNDIEKAEQQWKDEQAKKAEADRKPFSVQEFLAKKNASYLTYWTTPEQTEEAYKKGKSEIKATDANWVNRLFFWAHPQGMGRQNPADMEKMKEWFKRQFDSFSSPEAIDPAKPEKGYVIVRKTKYNDAELKKLDDAKPAIIERLKILDAVDLAEKDAKKVRDDWDQGKELPKLEDLAEIKGDMASQRKYPLLNKFFQSPKAVGEILPVAQGPAEQPSPDNVNPAPHEIFYVGFAVEIQLPTLATFEKDTQWDREQKRGQIGQSYSSYIGSAINDEISRKVFVPTGVKDPPLYEAYGRGDD